MTSNDEKSLKKARGQLAKTILTLFLIINPVDVRLVKRNRNYFCFLADPLL